MERVNEKDREFRFGDSGPKYLFRGPRMEWGILILKPGESLGAHYHREVEETFYFLEGKAKLLIDDAEYLAGAGDAFRLGPGDKHDILNDSPSPVRAVFIKCPYKPEDKISL
jgi:mannose-6-phosphate isomerase-like protein (cupin superfamily)